MRVRTLHRIIGIILLVPFFAWAITGLVFFFKPGYAGAYEILSPRTYPLNEGALSINPDQTWREFRYFRTVLGDHLIVRTDTGWQHLNPATRQPRNKPSEQELRLLLNDAFAVNPARYGEVSNISGDTIKTGTGVEISLNWNTMNFAQRGKDTDRIDLLYKIHYLQWTGIKSVDKVLGLVGMTLVMVLTSLGAWLAFKRN
jgi:hypothetical protein